MFLGRKGLVTSLMQDLKECLPDQKKEFGKLINDIKNSISESLNNSFEYLKACEIEKNTLEEQVDITLPGMKNFLGKAHPISQMIDKMIFILSQMGFSVYHSPELETEYYNYSGLNYPDDHPARDMQDTYYIDKTYLLRSHTTSFQQRVLENHTPPIRMICTGKCYRNETISTRSHVIFHQIDAIYIDKNVSFSDLISIIKEFYSKLFDENVEIRIRSSYFPFVKPGIEVDVKCTICNGNGCRLCKESGWLEVAGAGMVHPEILANGGLDPEVYSGFAWGGGIERVYLLLHGISDIRLFLENDFRFLEQFP